MSRHILAAFLIICPLLSTGLNFTRGQQKIRDLPDWEGDCEAVFPDPDDCRQFIECWAAVGASLWECTDDMLFDMRYLGCEHAQYVHCEDRPRPTDVPSTTNPPVTTTIGTTSNVTTSTTPAPSTTSPPPVDYDCPHGNGVFAHEEFCEYYWNCWEGDVVLVHCGIQGENYLFDRVYDGCNFPQYVDCDTRRRPDGAGPNPTTRPPASTTAPTTTQPPTTTTPGTGPTTPEPEPTQGTGPTTVATTTTTTTTTTPRPGEFQCPSDNEESDGNYPDPMDCTAFYTCSNGIPTWNQCTIPLFYNIPLDQCDYRNNVDCGTRP